MKSVKLFGNNSCVSACEPTRLHGVIPNLVTQTIKVSVSGSQNKTKRRKGGLVSQFICVKALVTKLDNLKWVPGIHMMEVENRALQVIF